MGIVDWSSLVMLLDHSSVVEGEKTKRCKDCDSERNPNSKMEQTGLLACPVSRLGLGLTATQLRARAFPWVILQGPKWGDFDLHH